MMKKKKAAPSAHCPDFQDDNMAALDELLQDDEKKIDELLLQIRNDEADTMNMLDELRRQDDENMQKLLTMEQDTPSLDCVVCTRRNCKKVK